MRTIIDSIGFSLFGLFFNNLESLFFMVLTALIFAKCFQLLMSGVFGRKGFQKIYNTIEVIIKAAFDLVIPLVKLLWKVLRLIIDLLLPFFQLVIDLLRESIRRVYDRRK